LIIKIMRGYTLLETVIYVSILAVIAVLALGSILSIYQAYGKIKVERKLAGNADVALERMVREIRAATTTDIGVSVFGSSPGILKIGNVKFSLSASTLQVEEGQGSPAPLTASDVKINSLIFYRETASESEIIKIEMALEAGSGLFKKNRNFFGSAVMRGIY